MLEFDMLTEPAPICGATRGKRGKVCCELPPDHIVGGLYEPVKLYYHIGRNAVGAWISWKV